MSGMTGHPDNYRDQRIQEIGLHPDSYPADADL